MINPAHGAETARPDHQVVGWKLERSDRRRLLDIYGNLYDRVIAEHVTSKARAAPAIPPPDDVPAALMRHVDGGWGLEAMAAAIDGTTGRPGCGTFHIAWPLGAKGSAKQSSGVWAAKGWTPLELQAPIGLRPASWQP